MPTGEKHRGKRSFWLAVVCGVAVAVVVSGLALRSTGFGKQHPGMGEDFFSNVHHLAYLSPMHAGDFHHPTVITNPFYPLPIGAIWRWKGEFRHQPYTQEDVVLK